LSTTHQSRCFKNSSEINSEHTFPHTLYKRHILYKKHDTSWSHERIQKYSSYD